METREARTQCVSHRRLTPGLLILPDGQISVPGAVCLSSLNFGFSENISLHARPKSHLDLWLSRPTEGRLAIVTDAGRDAVDAGGALTNVLLPPSLRLRRTGFNARRSLWRRRDADGEVVWS
jgi:hypothetical protein